MRKSIALGMLILAILILQGGPALANKSATSIEGPTSVAKGTEVTLRVTVTHNTNSSSHYTEWLKVTANKKEIARWDYTKEKRPEAAEFTKEIKRSRSKSWRIQRSSQRPVAIITGAEVL